jgi:hypothetical protein
MAVKNGYSMPMVRRRAGRIIRYGRTLTPKGFFIGAAISEFEVVKEVPPVWRGSLGFPVPTMTGDSG